MSAKTFDTISFWSLYAVIVLLPVFFLPFTRIPVETGKGLLVVGGLTLAIIAWSLGRFIDGKVVVPRSKTLTSGLLVVAVFFISSMTSPARDMSLFGLMFDLGTFWSMFTAYMLLLFSSIVFTNTKKIRLLLLGVLTSFSLLYVFQILHVFFPHTTMLGVLAGKTGNLVGSWNNLSILSLCGIVLALLLIECAYITKKHKILLTLFIIISLFITLLTNFPLTWELLALFSAFIFTYRVYLYRKQTIFSLHTRTAFPTHSLFVLIISLLFFVSGQFIGSYIPTKLGITNLEASPTFISTMGVLNGVLEQNPFTGMGPNNFAEAWARYKSPLVNSSSYWNIAFNTGSGLVPTFFITTGLFGVLALCTFFYFLYVPYKKKIFEKMLSREHTEVTILYMVTLCLSLASFLYTIGTTLFFLLFASLGVMIGASTSPHKGERITFSFLNDPRYSFFGMAVLVSLIVCSVSFAGFYTKRFISVSYFTKTLEATNTQDARGSISRAVELYPTDLYYRTYAQVELFTLKEILEKTKREGFGEESTASLKQSSDSALRLAESAVRFHPRNALNWEILGMVYESLSNVGLAHVYDKAIESYRMASALDPLNPRMKLIIANTLATEGKYEEAKNVVREALQLKQGYKDALGLLSQIEYAEKNSSLSPSK